MTLNQNPEHKIVVIEGPSGVGKDTVIKTLIQRYPDRFAKLISVATRDMRPGESQGHPYHFVDDFTFDQMLRCGDIFEHTVRHGKRRGMSAQYIEQVFEAGKIPLKDCDIVGVRALKSRFPQVITIFLTIDKAEIERRMHQRGDQPADIEQRLRDYDRCVLDAPLYDHVVENQDLEKTIDKIIEIIYNEDYAK